MKEVVIAYTEEYGVFMGEHKEQAFFAFDNKMGLYKIYAFKTMAPAEQYFKEGFPQLYPLIKFAKIKSSSEYPSVIDLITQGYKKYTHTMLLYMPPFNVKYDI